MRKQETILLVEDDIVDQMTVKRALKDIKIANPLKITSNGEEALEFLKDEKNELPGIILLDLNMPRMNGIEFLKIAKMNDRIRKIPVIVLTTSKEEKDRISTFDLSVAGYMIKPVDYLQFVEVIRTINLYWTLSELSG
ncbi:MAG: response regulator [wastewater metagenome]|nr:response regulator [Candidatus Loosdrechtia aerotolerans]